MSQPVTALLVAVPEAEPVVHDLRLRYDESARQGVPAHITVLFPFLPLADVSAEALASLERLFLSQRSFAFLLQSVGRFPATCYLQPSGPERFVSLTQAVWRAYPSYPPFAGEFESIVPHLTVAHGNASEAEHVAASVSNALAEHGPVNSVCRAVLLMENSAGRWRHLHEFPLAPEPSA